MKLPCIDARNNFQNSPWADRLKLSHADFNYYCQSQTMHYDLVVSNPPFFVKSLKSSDHASSVARHDTSLTFLQLINGARKLLSELGRLAVIIPFDAFEDFRETARLSGFFLRRKTIVIPKIGRQPKRILLDFSFSRRYPDENELAILIAQDTYSEDFIGLTKDFYLNFA